MSPTLPNDPPILDYGTGSPPRGLSIQPLPDGVRITFPVPPNPIPHQAARRIAEMVGEVLAQFGAYLIPVLIVFGLAGTISLIRSWTSMFIRGLPWQIYVLVALMVALAAYHFWTLFRHRNVA